MALDLYSENSSRTMSPRISFSHDLSQSDIVPVEQLLRSISSSSLDFNFCTNDTSDQLPSMADELFSNGKMLPTQIKKIPTSPLIKSSPSLPPPPPPSHSNQETEEKQSTKSFWGFKRSSSCGNGYARSLCPIPILSRSNSTGSSTSSKRSSSSSSSKESLNHLKQQQHSQQKTMFSQKPPLKKSVYGSSYGNTNHGIRVNPALNVASANMFGLGSIFSTGKDKNRKK